MSMSNTASAVPFVCMWCDAAPVNDKIAALKCEVEYWKAEVKKVEASRDLYRALIDAVRTVLRS
jgi:hypothetical protein